jgi:hypothetical protein
MYPLVYFKQMTNNGALVPCRNSHPIFAFFNPRAANHHKTRSRRDRTQRQILSWSWCLLLGRLGLVPHPPPQGLLCRFVRLHQSYPARSCAPLLFPWRKMYCWYGTRLPILRFVVPWEGMPWKEAGFVSWRVRGESSCRPQHTTPTERHPARPMPLRWRHCDLE